MGGLCFTCVSQVINDANTSEMLDETYTEKPKFATSENTNIDYNVSRSENYFMSSTPVN